MNLSGEQILKIIRDHDDFKNKVEIKENAKGEPSVSVTVRGDGTAREAVDEAIKEYKHAREQLAK